MLVDTNELLTVKEFAKKAKTYPSNVMHYINTKRLEYIKIDKHYYLNKNQLEEWPPEWKKMGRPRKYE